MATRGFRRALIAVAATILYYTTARFGPTFGFRHGEWTAIYGSSPPADSRLLAHYMTPPPEPASVKLRRKANNDAGGAFRRWARRRGKGAPRRDSGATDCGRPGYICRGHGSEKRCLPDASCK